MTTVTMTLTAAEERAIRMLRSDLAWRSMRHLASAPGNTRETWSMTLAQARTLVGTMTKLLGLKDESEVPDNADVERTAWNERLRGYVALVAYNPAGACVGIDSNPDRFPACPAAEFCCRENNNLNGGEYDSDACFRALWRQMTGSNPPDDWMPEREVTP